MLFSPSRGFQPNNTPAALRGEGAVKITRRRHRELIAAQETGAIIVVGDDGRPKIRRPRDTEAARRRFALQLVKQEARRRILEIAPGWRQANDNAAIAQAALEHAILGEISADFIPALDRRRAIDAIRAASSRLEAQITTMSAAELEAFDVGAEANWSVAR
ncbi:MAG TPA: hypothetical protein VF619_12690, partial [Allosphingosinicella sp.]